MQDSSAHRHFVLWMQANITAFFSFIFLFFPFFYSLLQFCCRGAGFSFTEGQAGVFLTQIIRNPAVVLLLHHFWAHWFVVTKCDT